MPDLKYWYRVLHIAFLNKLLIFFLIIIIIIEYMVIVDEWLDGSFESQSRLEKAQQWFDTRKSHNLFNTFLSLKQ
jgi:amino acid permease